MKLGDIIEIEYEGKLVYLQYVKGAKSKTRLERMRVFFEIYDERPRNIETIIKDDFFFLDFPYRHGIKENGIILIGNVPLPKDFVFPQYFRSINPFGKGWRIINDGGGQEVVEELTEEQKKLSPWGMWTIPLIFENIENGWRLENWI
ncbi:hypothetical protein [uncultured Aquimarina sp.]|uniref:hypothetical protein n=1 Tax=uncultured Aquimarina sp. TaxID=575652 RepID=UPI0026188242|nr:hypothetical protein [uncultured Aquimarina sp.]